MLHNKFTANPPPPSGELQTIPDTESLSAPVMTGSKKSLVGNRSPKLDRAGAVTVAGFGGSGTAAATTAEWYSRWHSRTAYTTWYIGLKRFRTPD